MCHIVIEKPAKHDKRITDVADEDAGRVHAVRLLGNIGDGAAGERIAQVFLFEVRALADEKRVFAERARIIGQAFDLPLQKLIGNGAAGQNAVRAQRFKVFLQNVDGVHKTAPLRLAFSAGHAKI